MFILMESVWSSGFFQEVLRQFQVDLVSVESILGVSVILSQLISNVPLVALIQPLLLHAGAGGRELMALAASSTIAGNLLILGAASNVIVIQNAERRSHTAVSFGEFARIGIPMTLVQTGIYWVFLRIW
jgi:Na+/H+ antiporter NhaD/arsenite permease-like protein